MTDHDVGSLPVSCTRCGLTGVAQGAKNQQRKRLELNSSSNRKRKSCGVDRHLVPLLGCPDDLTRGCVARQSLDGELSQLPVKILTKRLEMASAVVMRMIELGSQFRCHGSRPTPSRCQEAVRQQIPYHPLCQLIMIVSLSCDTVHLISRASPRYMRMYMHPRQKRSGPPACCCTSPREFCSSSCGVVDAMYKLKLP